MGDLLGWRPMLLELHDRGAVIWLTGLSGSGKSTLAEALVARLRGARRAAVLLDGDVLRRGLNADLGFSPTDRDENIRRAGAVAALFAEAGMIVVAALISPYRSGRRGARKATEAVNARFFEVFVDAPLAECERRDPKGLYRRARRGELKNFTGINAPFEAPTSPDLHLRTDRQDLDACLTSLSALVAEDEDGA